MKTGEDFLKEKGWDPNGPTLNGVLFKDFAELLDEYRLKILEEVKFGFDLCSDTSTQCLGYRNLVDRINREKSHEKVTKFPTVKSSYKPFVE